MLAEALMVSFPPVRAAMSSVELTDERKKEIGQHFVFGFIGTDLDENLRRLIQDYYVGHLILMKRNVRGTYPINALSRIG